MTDAGQPQRPHPERRDNDRVQLPGGLSGEIMVFQPISIGEVGRGGFHVETAFPLQLDSLHDFRLVLDRQTVVVKGRITHCALVDVEHEAVSYRSGVQFVELPERTRAIIDEFISKWREARHPRQA